MNSTRNRLNGLNYLNGLNKSAREFKSFKRFKSFKLYHGLGVSAYFANGQFLFFRITLRFFISNSDR
jgi:hypothetical protein